MTAMVHKYTLEDFNNIIDDGLDITLDAGIIDIIQQLADQVGAPEYVRTPHFVRKDKLHGGSVNPNNRRNKKKAVALSDSDWEAIRQFETTQREKKKGIDASVDIIRKTINKITDKTYGSLIGGLHEEFEKVADASEEDLAKLSSTVFSLVSETGFYSEMLATLFIELVAKYTYLQKDLNACMEHFKEWCYAINYVSPDEDYDGFCANNKENTRRKSVTKFLVNLARKEHIPQTVVLDLIKHTHDKLASHIDEDDKRDTLDEMSEIVAILTIEGKDYLSDHDDWDSIVTAISHIAKMKSKDHKSLSNKTVFKYMDILDVIG